MWTKFFASVKLLMGLFEELQSFHEEQKRFKDQLEAFESSRAEDAQLLRDLAHELLRLRDHDQHEREKIMLRLEVELLKFERRLPPKSE